MQTGIFIYGFPVYLIHMTVPPLHATAVGAESFLLSSGILFDGFSTLLATKLSRYFSIKSLSASKSMPLTIGLDAIDGDAQHP